MIRHAAPSRVGMLGNPSDGYGGRTLALAVPQFEAVVELTPAPEVSIAPGPDDEPSWPSLASMTAHLDRHGYGTGPQLLAATVRTFAAVAESQAIPLDGGFHLRYDTTIPRQVGLGGSSALVVATLRCLGQHFGLDLPPAILASVALRAETAELGVSAGLQDRVIQSYGGLVAMDFGHSTVDTRFGVSHGLYEELDPHTLPPLFLAWRAASAEPSGGYHQRLRSRFEAGDTQVREVLKELAALVVEGRAALRWRDGEQFTKLIGRNMELRRLLGPLPQSQLELVEVAEATGTWATFAGSGGAVVGGYVDDEQYERLAHHYGSMGAEIVRIGPGAEPDDRPTDDTPGDTAPVDNVVTLTPRSSE